MGAEQRDDAELIIERLAGDPEALEVVARLVALLAQRRMTPGIAGQDEEKIGEVAKPALTS